MQLATVSDDPQAASAARQRIISAAKAYPDTCTCGAELPDGTEWTVFGWLCGECFDERMMS